MEVEIMKYKLLLLLVVFFFVPVTSAFSFDTITPEEAFDLVATNDNVFILDVRTADEWKWVGHPGADKLGEGSPELDGKVINISSHIFKKGIFMLNRSFLKDVNEVFKDYPDVTLIAMCRSGARAAAAAQLLEDNGYIAINMAEAFEGSADARGYRTVNGWVNSGLPYTYSGAGYKD
jgi:rhodanese-related sulfurtransferase